MTYPIPHSTPFHSQIFGREKERQRGREKSNKTHHKTYPTRCTSKTRQWSGTCKRWSRAARHAELWNNFRFRFVKVKFWPSPNPLSLPLHKLNSIFRQLVSPSFPTQTGRFFGAPYAMAFVTLYLSFPSLMCAFPPARLRCEGYGVFLQWLWAHTNH